MAAGKAHPQHWLEEDLADTLAARILSTGEEVRWQGP